MANELQFTFPTGSTLDLCLLNSTGLIYNGSGFEAINPTNEAAYDIVMGETGTTGIYLADMPSVAAGVYYPQVRLRPGANFSLSNIIVSDPGASIEWNGSAVVEPDQPAAATTTTTGIAPALNGLGVVYCTDENIALRAWGDYTALCPASQKLAYGSDGVIGPSDRWTLSSATADFDGYGVVPGNVVLLKAGNTFASNGELFAINSVAEGRVTLRRLGHAANVGAPPAPVAGLTGITFSVLTFGPQIDIASYDANHFFGVDVISPTKSPAQLYDQRELQSYVVLGVLKWAYAILAKAKAEDYALKFEQVSAELDSLTARLTIRWGARGDDAPPTSIFSCRARR